MRKQGKRFNKTINRKSFMQVIIGVQPLEKEQQDDLGLAYRLAFEETKKGRGSEELVNTIAYSLNIALILAEEGYGTDWIPAIQQAQQGIARCQFRGRQEDKWVFDGDAIKNIAEVIDLHDEQLALAKQKEVSKALTEVKRRVENRDVYEITTL